MFFFEAVGGILIAFLGTTVLFLLDSATFAVAGLFLLSLRLPSLQRERKAAVRPALTEYVADLRAGVEALRGTVFVEMMLSSAVFNFAVGMTLAVLPAFGESLGGPAIYGLLLGALGMGRVFGSVVASHLDHVAYGRLKASSYLLSAALWLGSVYSSSVVVTIALFGLAWISASLDAVLAVTLSQKAFSTDILGRVSTIQGIVSTGTLPVGSLLGGFIAEQLGTTMTVGLAAFGFGFAGLYFVVRSPLRRLPAVKNANLAKLQI